MKTRCPACGATCSLDALLVRKMLSICCLLNLTGDLAKPLVKYLALFRESRDLTFERTAKLLSEITLHFS
jgi:hypothetical protein